MNILWVSPFLPQADATHAGGRASFAWLSRTAERHAVTLLCRLEPGEGAAADRLRPLVRALHLHAFARPDGAASVARIAGSYWRLGRAADRLLRQDGFDVLHVEYLETGLGVPARRGVPRLVVAIDELGKPARQRFQLARGAAARVASWGYWRGIERLQRRICRKFDRVLALSERDARVLRGVDAALSVGVLPLPIGIDADRVDGHARDGGELLFVGAMHRDANADAVTWFCREILPRIRAQVPAARLTVAGAAPTEAVQRLAADRTVTVTGFVPALEPYYARAAAFVAPLRIAGGAPGKTIDALAAGCAVVTTSVGNEGVGATPGTHLLVADEPAPFAAAVARVLGDAGLARRLGAAGRDFARARFSLQASMAVLEREHAALAAGALTTR